MSNKIVGKIHLVKCENFVTYDKATIYTGEFLNVIVGPNGSGKSTIVAAIVLGLGGNPKLLSRSSSIQDYIKNGKESANIEVQIYKDGNGAKIMFGRSFDIQGKSTYFVDKAVVTHREYVACINKFNIQINNLCQFLPQDRVQDFAKMNPQEILLNTLSSVCSDDVIKNFDKLKQMRNYQKDSCKTLKENLDKLKEIESRNAQLKEQIDRMNIRKQLQRDIDVCESKKMWLEYEQIQNSVKQTKNELGQAEDILKKNKANYDQILKNIENVVKKREQMENSVKNEESRVRQISSELDELQNKSDKFENDINDSKLRFESKKNEISERENELKKETVLLTGLISDLKVALDELGPENERNKQQSEYEREIMQTKAESKSLLEEHRKINRKLDEQYQPELQSIKRKITSLENIGDRKLANIRDNFEDVYKATQWIRQNRSMFEAQIYEPMVLELNINNGTNAKYIENVVNKRDLLAFTCESKSDMNTLIKHLCNDKGLKINVIHSDAAEECLFQAKQPIETIRRFGFSSYLIDMLSGPAPILNYLCRIYGIQSIPAGTEEVNDHTEEIPKHIKIYFAGNNKVTTLYSKYSGEKSTMRTEISEGKLLSVGVDVREISNLKKKLFEITKSTDVLKNERSEIESKLNFLEQQRKEIQNKKKAIEQKLIAVEKIKEKIKKQKLNIQRMENESTDIEEEEKIFKNTAKNFVEKLLALDKQKIKLLENYLKASEIYNVDYTKLQIYKMENSNVENRVSELKEGFMNSKQLVETIQASYERLQSKCQKILKALRELSSGYKPTDAKFPYTQEYAKLPNEIDQLNDMILEMQTKVNCMLTENQDIYEEYQQRQQQIDQMRLEIHQSTQSTSIKILEMEELHNKWYPEVMSVVETINASFGKFMSSMEYVGEVQLSRKEEFEYDSYGIQILVKYRNDSKLQVLDRFVQSGGERAVAIAVYTLSLQRITHVPFRCVDEINQGMDANNETKVFDMLVQETAQPGHSQYFFITPKLLPNLTYNKYMTFHIVYNGTFVSNDQIFYG